MPPDTAVTSPEDYQLRLLGQTAHAFFCLFGKLYPDNEPHPSLLAAPDQELPADPLPPKAAS